MLSTPFKFSPISRSLSLSLFSGTEKEATRICVSVTPLGTVSAIVHLQLFLIFLTQILSGI
jgi:hypothetical protein